MHELILSIMMRISRGTYYSGSRSSTDFISLLPSSLSQIITLATPGLVRHLPNAGASKITEN